jgi:5-methylthioadenosine/S-adenosylhomocysteine deaminase
MNDTEDQYRADIRPDLVIEGGILLTMRPGEGPIHHARLLIKGDRILDIQSGEKASSGYGAEVIDAREGIIMPGMINGHVHAAMTIFRGLADDLPLNTWLFEKIFPAESRYLNQETVYWGTLLACLEMIASGTTTFMDGYFYEDGTVRAVHESGLRAFVAQGVIDFPAPGVPDPKENLKVGRDFIEAWLDFSELITPGLFCHSPLTCSSETMVKAMEISRDYRLPLQIHLSETREEVDQIVERSGKRPVHYLDQLGLLGGDLIAAHAIHLDDEELDVISRKDLSIVHVPESNMKLASGIARVPEMLKKGLRVGLGTDGCASNNNLDLFQEMDVAAKMHKVFSWDPTSLNAETALQMTTSRGAAVLGIDKTVGTLEKGKKADVIVIGIKRPHLVPLYNPFSTLVYSANGPDVKDVIVNGRVLMKDRSFQTLDDEEIMERVHGVAEKIQMG